MKSIKTLAYLTATFAYALIVLGAVVRITNSGLGCGDHWPLCNGQAIPTFTDHHVVIEYAHRIAALGLFALLIVLVATAVRQRNVPGVSGRGGPQRPAFLAFGLYFVLAVLGAVVVKLDLKATAVVLHLGTALALLSALLVTGWRASVGERGALPLAPIAAAANRRVQWAAIAAVAIAGVTILLGGLTATTGASTACQGFPLCNGQIWPSAGNGGLAHLQWIHRLFAYALFGHLIGFTMGARRRGASADVRKWAGIAFGAVTAQVIVAAVMVLAHLPTEWRALHQAVGVAVWIAAIGVVWRVRRPTA